MEVICSRTVSFTAVFAQVCRIFHLGKLPHISIKWSQQSDSRPWKGGGGLSARQPRQTSVCVQQATANPFTASRQSEAPRGEHHTSGSPSDRGAWVISPHTLDLLAPVDGFKAATVPPEQVLQSGFYKLFLLAAVAEHNTVRKRK